MTDFTEDHWKWLDDFDNTPVQGGSAADDQPFPWHNDTAPNQGLAWERSLAEEASSMTDFLKKLAHEVESSKEAQRAQQEIIEAQAKKLKVLDKVTDYLQELESHLDKLRDLFKEVMPKIDPDWDLKSPAFPAIFNINREIET